MTQSASNSQPFVSIVMPIRNEAAFIGDTLTRVLQQDYPADRFEVIVADGASNDGTQEILQEIQARHEGLRVIANPDRIVTTGLNAAIKQARGDIIIWLGGHTRVEADYVRCNVEVLNEHAEAWIVGGPLTHAANGSFGKAVAIAMSHPLGVGNANHHFADFEGYVDGAPFPAIRRSAFEQIGYFDERLVRNQDDEFYYRVRKSGGKIFITPRIRCVYYVRERIGLLFRQYFQYSFWRIPVMRKHRRPTTLRQVVPLAFYAAVIALLVIGVWLGQPIVAFGLPSVYLLVLAIVGLFSLKEASLAVACRVPVAIATMHFAYAAGMVGGLIAAVLRPRAWSRQGSMATLSR